MPDTAMPKVGQSAPPIEATATGGAPFSLTAQLGKWIVIYFYPRANTPG